MVASGTKRKSGSTGAEEAAVEAGETLTEEIETEVLPEERKRQFRTPGFARMRTAWHGDDALIKSQVEHFMEERILHDWIDVFQVMNQVYDLVRTPEYDETTGEVKRDRHGYTIWARNEFGGYDEDFSRLTHSQRENLLFVITTRMFEWEQRAERAWLESMLAKAQWEERFAIDYDAPRTGTVDDRKAVANKGAADERYFAIFQASYSRRCGALVRSMGLLGQRIRDTMAS